MQQQWRREQRPPALNSGWRTRLLFYAFGYLTLALEAKRKIHRRHINTIQGLRNACVLQHTLSEEPSCGSFKSQLLSPLVVLFNSSFSTYTNIWFCLCCPIWCFHINITKKKKKTTQTEAGRKQERALPGVPLQGAAHKATW